MEDKVDAYDAIEIIKKSLRENAEWRMKTVVIMNMFIKGTADNEKLRIVMQEYINNQPE